MDAPKLADFEMSDGRPLGSKRLQDLLLLLVKNASGTIEPFVEESHQGAARKAIGAEGKNRIKQLFASTTTRADGQGGTDSFLVIPVASITACGLNVEVWERAVQAGIVMKAGEEYLMYPDFTQVFLELARLHAGVTNVGPDKRANAHGAQVIGTVGFVGSHYQQAAANR